MRLKLYRAADAPEAMAMARRELGADALILSVRRTGGGVELTAAAEPEEAGTQRETDENAARDATSRARTLAAHGVPEPVRLLLPETLPLGQALDRVLPFAALPLAGNDAPLLIAGPPGAGKTLTVARLAARLVLSGERPVILTTDGDRAGAVEQLAAFTRLLGLQLRVACHPETLARALAGRGHAPVLIDTPGGNPFDPGYRGRVEAIAAATGARIAAALPAGLDAAEAAELGASFADAGARLLVATRIDLARRLGSVIAAAAAGRLALAEAGVSPDAATGLVPLTPDFLAARLSAMPGAYRP